MLAKTSGSLAQGIARLRRYAAGWVQVWLHNALHFLAFRPGRYWKRCCLLAHSVICMWTGWISVDVKPEKKGEIGKPRRWLSPKNKSEWKWFPSSASRERSGKRQHSSFQRCAGRPSMWEQKSTQVWHDLRERVEGIDALLRRNQFFRKFQKQDVTPNCS